MSEHAVTVLITRSVKAGCEVEFERVSETLMQIAASFEGFLGAQLIRPGDDSGVHDSMYHVVLAFDSQAHLDAWHDSPQRELGLAATTPLIEGGARVKPMAGLGLWFQSKQQGPPRWKVAVVTWLGIFPTVYVLFWITGDLLKSWTLLARTALLTLAVVALMTWVVAPRLTNLLKSWLFAHHRTAKPKESRRAGSGGP
jgi:antibiotic biosynthesis monooxygenase (ABM) superfamily enzyme